MNEPIVTVNSLEKTYWLYPTTGRRLLGCFVNPLWVGGSAYRALSGLNFELYPGEAIALIGKNGAGKSTALQVLAGITPPTGGSFQIKGRICALLELGSGFNPEFTGRQNIALAGILLGLTHEKIRREEQNIIDFADIGEFIDQPVKFYSSGMFVRLAFAVAVAGQPDLLIVDEALAVGDIFFRQKCYARLREMREKGMAIILVTHSPNDAQEFCDRAILLEYGRQTYIGEPKEAMLRYYISMQPAAEPSLQASATIDVLGDAGISDVPFPLSLRDYFAEVAPNSHTVADGGRLLRFCLTDEHDVPCRDFIQGGRLRLYAQCTVERTAETPFSSMTIWTASGTAVYGKGTPHYAEVPESPSIERPSTVYICHEVKLDLATGEYVLSFGFSEAVTAIYRNRHLTPLAEWVAACTRRINIAQLAVFTVSAPTMGCFGVGLVDLPSGGWMQIQPL